MTRYNNILKVDCDTLLDEHFFSYHNLSRDNVFFAGDWKQSRNENERHTNGIIYMKREDFFRVGGYNEFITTYGYDDCDLYKRLEKHSKRLLINLNSVKHIEHSNTSRTENQIIKYNNRLDIEIEKNRLIAELNLWNSTYSYFDIEKISNKEYKANYLYGVELNETIKNRMLEQAVRNRGGSVNHNVSKRKLYINTKNGLSNRLRAFASAYNIAKASNRKLVVIWIPDFHCEAKFTDLYKINSLFKDIEFIEESSKADFPKTIEYKVAEYEDLNKNRVIYNYDKANNTYIDDTTDHDIYIISACSLNNKHVTWHKDSALLRQLEPTDEIIIKINEFNNKYKLHEVIGVHIRMGQPPEKAPYENISNYNESTKQSCMKWRASSHYSVFLKEMDRIVSENPEQVFLLCCDNEEGFNEIIKMDKYKIISTEKVVYDRSKEQVKSAVIDLILLAKTKYMLGSNWSSFTEIAHRLSGKPLKLAGVDF